MLVAINGPEVVVLLLWAAGVLAAVLGASSVGSRRRTGLVLVAVLVPLLGSLLVLLVVGLAAVARRHEALDRVTREPGVRGGSEV